MATSTRQPTYRKHKSSGQAVVTFNGKDFYLGVYGTQASRAEYDRLIAEWLVGGRQIPASAVSLAEILRQFWQWVETHYRKPDGTPTSEVCQFRYSLRPLNYLCGALPAAEFGPLKLKTVRQLMIDGFEHPRYGLQRPCSRDVINKRINRIKLMFKWASENSLLTVRGLQRGRTSARETDPVRPVSDSIIQATRPFLSTPVRAMVDLQLLTGARPGEVCSMRACNFDITGPIWIYRPESHKNEYRRQSREIYLGPRAQEIVKTFFRSDLQANLFSPRDADAERQLARRKSRKTPLFPSHLRRLEQQRKKSRTRAIRDHYDVASYRRAIAYACSKAIPLPDLLGPALKPNGQRESEEEWKARFGPQQHAAIRAWKREHFWHPHQLRHNAATNLRKQFGVELARIILGHATAFTTEIYAEADRQHAMDVIGKGRLNRLPDSPILASVMA